MEPGLGPPDAMADKREELTPMMAQYLELCTQYDEALVLFQVGDFYETFCDAAEACARELELTLTSRKDSTGEYPMAGIPVDSAPTYIEALLEAGYRVAVADQIEEPGESQGVVERAVTRVVTPGTLTEDELLSSDDNNFVAAIARNGANETGDGSTDDSELQLGIALLDVSTGDFFATGSTSSEAISDEVNRFSPSEAVLGPGVPHELVPETCLVTQYEAVAFEYERARTHVREYFGDPDTLLASDAEIRACGALLSYAEYARSGVSNRAGVSDETHEDTDTDADSDTESDRETTRLEYLTHLTRYDPREYLSLDAVALRSLEVFEPRAVGGLEEATLVGVLDETASALGGRKLKDWLRRPLLDPGRIEGRLDAVAELQRSVKTREEIHDHLQHVYDLERLIARISRERANARDLRSLAATLAVVPEIRSTLEGAEATRLQELHAALDPLTAVREELERAIVEEPPLEITEGGIIAEGYDEDLDAIRTAARDGKRWIESLEESERERTGISSLKVGYTSVHGYYIEVTNPNLEDVPEEYERRQTLKRAERFVTPELREREDEIVGAERRADDREYDIFCEIRREVAEEVERVQALADALATLDALVSLATVAAQYDYCRPEILDPAGEEGSTLEIEGGRHPVVERTQESFVPNDATFDDQHRFAVITGPNMSGKSTYMRQVALIVLLAQVGSFVPARRVQLTPLERIFTRVGASDDIAGGRSTFMVEMDELATILREADERSLVLLDEVGRGTSTADGLAIAQAIAEHLHDEVGATTLFATHHHPLTDLARDLERAFTLHFEANQNESGEVVFHHEIEPGAATGSYGVEVATAAGVPDSVVERSRELVISNADADARVDDPAIRATGASADGGDDLTDVASELRALEPAHLTPLEALTELDRLKRMLEEQE